ncbi:MAG: type I-E CRISPR-associated protein Cas7/Cse4/CasC [Thermomicrobiales bacterium]|nr:type I-E CRISPR-associated protein Cas7/Cse4/CasC [Thermomicrobiales bacterium]
MLLELHMLQNFAPSNLNRDDTGSPKDCDFGGVRRARISSQCQKRAIREAFRSSALLPAENLGVRTKRLAEAVARRLTALGHPEDEARQVAEAAIAGVGLGLKAGETEYLIFLGDDEIAAIASACHDNWDALTGAATGARTSKKEAKAAVPKELAAALGKALAGDRAADVALFGRMLADLPARNRDAACQVAHALSTNAVSMEFDFFTAVDDLKPAAEDVGAGMLGTVEFNSSCYYRYANIDLGQLLENLGGDTDLARATVRAFLTAAVHAVPTGKQNSFAAQNPPSLVMGVVREDGAWSLANAFVKPVRPTTDDDLIGQSISALADYWKRLTGMYGDDGVKTHGVAVDGGYAKRLNTLEDALSSNVPELIDDLTGAAYPAGS